MHLHIHKIHKFSLNTFKKEEDRYLKYFLGLLNVESIQHVWRHVIEYDEVRNVICLRDEFYDEDDKSIQI